MQTTPLEQVVAHLGSHLINDRMAPTAGAGTRCRFGVAVVRRQPTGVEPTDGAAGK